MAFCTIHGLTVGVTRASPHRARRRARGRARRGAATGDETEARRTSKEAHELVTDSMPPDEAESLENLLLGRGHVWTLAYDLASSGAAGIRQHAAAQVFTFLNTGAPYAGTDGAYQTRILSGQALDFIAGLTASRWTFLVSKGTDFYAFRSTGNHSKNGAIVASSSLPWCSRQSNGDVRLEGKNDAGVNANADFGQIVALPWLAPDTHVNAWTAWTTRRWGRLPVLDVSGSMIKRAAIFARAAFSQSGIDRASSSGTFQSNRRVVSFALTEA